jgi:hypothetical protein
VAAPASLCPLRHSCAAPDDQKMGAEALLDTTKEFP